MASPGDDLCKLPPLKIDATQAEQHTFKEMMSLLNAQVSMNKTGLYESGASGFTVRLFPCARVAAGLPSQTITWDQLETAEALYAEEAFRASSDIPALRRFIIPGIFPTSIEATAVVTKLLTLPSKDQHLTDLPLYAGRAILLAWWVSLYGALRAQDFVRVRKLVEAYRCITARVRLAPSPQQLRMDLLGYSNDLQAHREGLRGVHP